MVERRILGALDVESVRFCVERDLAKSILAIPGFAKHEEAMVPSDPAVIRRRLLAEALRLTATMAPPAHAQASEAQRVLGIEGELELYQSGGRENAALHLAKSPILLEIQGRMLSLLDHDAGVALFGHELGHYLAHGPWTELGSTQVAAIALAERGLLAHEHVDIVRRLVVAREVTADRFGLLAAQDLTAALRLEMIATTGLSGDAITWDTDAYLAQSRELMESTLARGEAAVATTHPEHSLRAWATWLFSETDVYQRLTGRGPGTRTVAEVDALVAKVLRAPALELATDVRDEAPPFLSECALASAVLVASADGELCPEELEAIEDAFSKTVPGWAELLDPDVALDRFYETGGLVRAGGPDLVRRLFLVLTHVMGADDVVDAREIQMILAIGEALGYAADFRKWIRPAVEAMGATVDVDLDKTTAVPLPVRKAEIKAALDALCDSVERRGESTIAPRRLLRIIGATHDDVSALGRVSKVFVGRGIEATPALADAKLDDAVRLIATRRREAAAQPAPIAASRAALIAALARLRDELVSGDGRSPSVRLRRLARGRHFDLVRLDEFHVGAAERVLALCKGGRRAQLVTPDDAGRHESAATCSEELRLLDRETRDRKEETGANDLFLGYPILFGNIGPRGQASGGYAVRAPLVLHPVDLVRDGRGARGFSLVPRSGDDPIANQSLIRLLFNKAALALPDELGRELDEIAADPQRGTKDLLDKLREVGLQIAPSGSSLVRFGDRDRELDESPPLLAIEECAVLGLFPQSSSDLLQDYDALLRELADPRRALADQLAAATGLLPAALAPEVRPSQTSDALGWPVVEADPSQRDVAAACRNNLVTVVDGPPGTGKSQLIVNLVADALRRGERVAVVAEKRAALDVVRQRLAGRGLGHAIAVVHDVNDDRRPLFQMIAERLEGFRPREFSAARHDALRKEYANAEATLHGAMQVLGFRPEGAGFSVGQLMAIASGGPAVFDEPRLAELDRDALQRLLELAERLYAHQDLWAPAAWWRTRGGAPRGSLERQDDAALARMRETIRAAIPLAEGFERALAESPVPEGALVDARSALASAGVLATPTPAIARMLAAVIVHGDAGIREIASTWSQSSTALARWTSPTGLSPDDELARDAAVLQSYAGRFARFFSMLWWQTRSRVRRALVRTWPERAGAAFDAAFLAEIRERLEAARAWARTHAVYAHLQLADLAPADATAARHTVAELSRVVELAAVLVAAEGALGSIGLPIPRAPDAVLEFGRGVGARAGQLAARDALRGHTASLESLFPWLARASSTDLRDLSSRLEVEAHRLRQVDAWFALVDELGAVGRSVLDAIATARPTAAVVEWREAITRAWATAHLQHTRRALPQLSDLGTAAADQRAVQAAETMRRIESELRDLETESIAAKLDAAELLTIPAAEYRARRSPKQKAKEAILKEIGKKTRLLPLRRFVREFSPVGLLDALPCWLVSPETMAVLFPREPLFDLVIFDEASQCTVEAGLPVMLRAKRVVVAGDEKQMPPSSYFELGAESTEDEDRSEDELQTRDALSAESLLALARSRCPHAGLTWHYRCREEELIAFSNHSMYDGQLLTIPSTRGPDSAAALRWLHVEDGRYDAGLNRPEAERVVSLVGELLARTPRPTIGVVTFNLKQRATILDAIERRVAADERFATLWRAANEVETLDERPFVRNLETVQGDERDVIIFSLGHAPVERKRKGGGAELFVPARFGPLGHRGGERRLNVAISRAKLECWVVASFDPKLLHVGNATHAGPRLFKAFLEFAHCLAHGQRLQANRVLEEVRGTRLQTRTASARKLADGHVPLAMQIAMALEERGYRCELGLGSSNFRIPLAIAANGSDSLRLAVLADEGDDVVSAFERHVHRPGVLALRGWDVLHVSAATWSNRATDVLGEVERRLQEMGVHVPEQSPDTPRRSALTTGTGVAARGT